MRSGENRSTKEKTMRRHTPYGNRNVRAIISGGGTGGHVFPAIAIADALRRMAPGAEILFVGANGRMEMERVPAAGYDIVGLDIRGIDRRNLWKNLSLPFKLWQSMRSAKKILRDFRPDVAVGVGGYASGPLLLTASRMRIPTLIQEQNSHAGLTNKRLGRRAAKICVAYEGMEQFFPKEKILLTGNPIRRASVDIAGKREQALAAFGLAAGRKTILLTGGSLGARTLNGFMQESLPSFANMPDVQVIWQCGTAYHERVKAEPVPENVRVLPFLQRMDLAYAAADMVISRAGAGTISELCTVGKPVVLVPSPNVAEDHQTKNAQALVAKGAAVMVADQDVKGNLLAETLRVLSDEKRARALGEAIKKLALLDADEAIAKEVLKLVKKQENGQRR